MQRTQHSVVQCSAETVGGCGLSEELPAGLTPVGHKRLPQDTDGSSRAVMDKTIAVCV